MNANINWTKLYYVTGVAAVVLAGIGWTFERASAFAPLPGQVADHERRICALESENATNQVRLDDRLDRIDADLKVMFERMGTGPVEMDGDRGMTNSMADRK